jgi:hypothetical protein
VRSFAGCSGFCVSGSSLLFAALALLVASCGGSSTLSAKSLQQQADAARSAAAEGALLADQVARDRTTEPFARIHSGALAEQAKAAAESLTKAQAPAPLESERKEAAAAARSTFAALERLHGAPDDQAVARRVEAELRRLSE